MPTIVRVAVSLLLTLTILLDHPGYVCANMAYIDAAGAGAYTVNKWDQIFYHTGTYKNPENQTGSWLQLNGRFRSVSVGGDTVWAIRTTYEPYIRTGISPEHPMGTDWKNVKGVFKYVSVSPKNHVWGIGHPNSNIWKRLGTDQNMEGYDWERVDGKATHISVGPAGVWHVNAAGDIYCRIGTYGDTGATGSHWVKVEGNKKYIFSMQDSVMGINSANKVYVRYGISAAYPTGRYWSEVKPHA